MEDEKTVGKVIFDSEKLKNYRDRLSKKKKELIIINITVFFIALLVLLFFVQPYFKSSIIILPEFGRKSTLSQFNDIAALAGLNLGEGPSTAIYQSLVYSEAVLEPVILTKYDTEEFNQRVNLISYFDIADQDDLSSGEEKREAFIDSFRKLNELIETDIDNRTQVLNIVVTMPESKLSADVANNIVLSLDNYLRTKMKTKASEQRGFIENRITQVKDSLREAEEELKNFREQNRSISRSPQLLLEQARLTRKIEIVQAIYLELRKQYEIAKIDEVKDTPVLNIQEMAKEPVKKAGPPRVLILFIVLIISFLTSTVIYAKPFKK